MSRLTSNLGAALISLREQWRRSVLSALGILVASFAIVSLISIALGVERDVSSEVDELGVNILIVLPSRLEDDSMFAPGLMGISQLAYPDVERVRALPGVAGVSPLTFVGAGPRFNTAESPATLVIACEPEWFRMRSMAFREGAHFDSESEASAVCVLGSKAKDKLFGDAPALGKSIRYLDDEFKVVGVSQSTESSSSLLSQGGFENMVYIPYRWLKAKQPEAPISRIMIQFAPGEDPDRLVASVEGLLGKRLNRDSYSVITQKDLLKLVFKFMSILTWLLVGLTSIALFVGGVGIMTVMLMSVNERAKEIGIRKTAGATRGDVFAQFLFEAVVIALLGGAGGVVLSAIATGFLAWLTPVKPLITLGVVALSLGVCVGVGTVFGLIPAMKAAFRDPVESLRYE
ncbi:MAG: ABC transporter permease [Fimbriimonadaceae bacterium]|nr:ABC transporter permease [Fimbriimonadaceae bacterium]QOJ11486.1 MAG: ABC transporter permease [Chthonomonadaceae bacterium]